MKAWKSYEEVATYILDSIANEFGVDSFQGNQKVLGRRSRTTWNVEAKGVREGDEGFLIVECRRYTTSKQNQEKLAGLAYRILDTGADGALIVTPIGLQEGARKVAGAENIINVYLEKNSTIHDYVLSFLNKLMIGKSEKVIIGEFTKQELRRKCHLCNQVFYVKENESICPKCKQ